MEADEEGCTLLWKQQTRRKRILPNPLTETPIFRTALGTQQYQAFEATLMACDASHLWNYISLNLDRMQGATDNPAEFTADEDINRPKKGSKASEGAQARNKKNKKTELALSPSLQLPTSPIMNSLSSTPQQMMTKPYSYISTAVLATCHLISWNN